MEKLTRVEMAAIIDGGQALVFNGRVYTNSADLPTQEEIDAIYSSGGSVSVDLSPVTDKLGAGLPAALGTNGGVKVSIVDGGGGGGATGGLTDAELRATPVPVADGGGSLTVDGAVSVSNFPATQPVSGTVAVSNLPATQPVSGTVDVGNFPASQPVTDNGGSLTVDSAQLPAALTGAGNLKVDIVANTAGVGGGSDGDWVTLYSNVTHNVTTEIASAEIDGTGYKGIWIDYKRASGTANTVGIGLRFPWADGTYGTYATTYYAPTISSGSQTATWVLHPSNVVNTASFSSTDPMTKNGYLPKAFKITLGYSTATPSTGVYLRYRLLK